MKGSVVKGSIVRGLSMGLSNNNNIEEFMFGPRRIEDLAFCQRCGCRLSQYRDPNDTLCCSCQRALNPLFRRPA